MVVRARKAIWMELLSNLLVESLNTSEGTLIPIALLALTQVLKLPAGVRKKIYVISRCLTLIGIFAMRWNVVIGGQLFSKSFLGYTTYKVSLITREGFFMTIALSLLPLALLWVLVKLLPPWYEKRDATPADTTALISEGSCT